jgi:hypothetical protein
MWVLYVTTATVFGWCSIFIGHRGVILIPWLQSIAGCDNSDTFNDVENCCKINNDTRWFLVRPIFDHEDGCDTFHISTTRLDILEGGSIQNAPAALYSPETLISASEAE